MIIPKIKNENFNGKYISINANITVFSEKYSNEICKLFKYFLPQCEPSKAKNAVVNVTENKKIGEKYVLSITDDGKITIMYGTYESLRNAVATLSMLAKEESGDLKFPCGNCEDFPVLGHRGVMLDLARGIKDFEKLKRDVILIAKLKLNVLHLHLSDGDGACFQMESMPEEYRIKDAYTKAQMKELAELAKILALEIIPEFDVPAHSIQMIKIFPDFGCTVPGKPDIFPWTVCPGVPEIYEVYEKVIKEISDLFPGKYFHMGGDELEFADKPELEALCYWDECEKCHSLREKEGLKDRQEEYYYFVKRIYDIVKKIGRQLVMWSDQLDCARQKMLPDDIVMHYWRVASPGRGPVEGCSMNAQLKMGYKVINSNCFKIYLDRDDDMTSAAVKDWRWDECDSDVAAGVIGSEFCCWDYGKAGMPYDRTLPSAAAVMADKYWSGKKLEYSPEYSESVTRAILGVATPEKLDVFKCLGDIMPQKINQPAYFEKVTVSKEELLETIKLLETKGLYQTGDSDRAKTFSESIKAVCDWLNAKEKAE